MALGKKDWFNLNPKSVYLTHGTFGASLKSALDNKIEWQKKLESDPFDFLINEAPKELANSRNHLAKYINCNGDDLVYFPNPSTALNAVIKSLNLKKNIALTSRPSDEELYGSYQQENIDFDILGLKVKISEDNKIIIKEIEKDSSLEKEDIKLNDIITQIDESVIKNIEDYYNAVANVKTGDMVLIGITTVNKSKNFSQTYSRYIAIKVD
ncbi:PDZ domain-containing protein [Candidatus Marinimicrobia bacterium]|nr:PDZ domain-containing protein [Candidatus Neomarinimicrobiota bacterium]